MLFAAPGVGKSIVATQMALSLSSATPLFGSLTIPKPRRVYYLQLEGDYAMYIERIRRMKTRVPYVASRLFWDLEGDLNCMDPLSVRKYLTRIGETHSEVVILDPLYTSVTGALGEEVPSKAIVRFSDRIRQTLPGCAVVFIHHTTKSEHDAAGNPLEDPFYGSQWLRAHIDTSYQLKRGPEKNWVSLYCKKDRGGEVHHQIFLQYDAETDTCHVEHAKTKLASGEARVLAWIQECKAKGVASTTFAATLAACVPLSPAHLRRIQQRLMINRVILLLRKEGLASEWTIV